MIPSSVAPGRASSPCRTRTIASATTDSPEWPRSRSYTSMTEPTWVFSTGTTAAPTVLDSSAANTSPKVREGTGVSCGKSATAAASE